MQRRVRVTVLAGGIAAAIVSAVAAVVLSPPPARLLTSVVVLLGVGFALGRVLWPRLVWVTRAGSVLVRVGGSVLFRPGGIEAYRYLRARRVPRIGRPVPLTRPYLVPLELPPPGLLIGRDAELQDVLDYAEQPAAGPRVVVIHGPAGIGKTTLAIKAAHLMAARYADGVLFASLAGFTLPASGARPDAAADPPDPPGEELTGTVLGAFVESLQGPGDRVPYGNAARLDRFRELTATTKQRVLIVLDDAPGVDAVLPLIPAGPAGAVLITSRDPLPELEPQLSLSLGPLGDTAATHLLKMVVGAERIEREETAAHAIVERADGHPLALQLAAGSLASRGGWTLSATVERMSQFRRPLIGAGGSPFAGALDLSYALLTEEERRAVRLLGLLDDRTFAPWMLAALLEATEKTAWRVSARLVHARLLEDVTDDATGVTAFRVLEHVQRYARARLYAEASEQECQAARRRQRSAERMRGEHSPRTTLRHIVYPELERGLLSRALNHARGALAQSRENLAAAQGALGEGSRLTRARLVDLQESKGLALAALAEVLAELGGVQDAQEMARKALATEIGIARPRALRCIGKLQRRQRRLDEAAETLDQALAAAQLQEDDAERVRVWRELAIVHACAGRTAEGLSAVAEGVRLCELMRDKGDRLLASLWWARAVVLLDAAERTGDTGSLRTIDAELVLADQYAERYKQRLWRGWIGHQRARVSCQLRRHDLGRVLGFRAMEEFAQMGHRYGTARCRLIVGKSYLDEGRPVEALPVLEEALSTFATCGDRWIQGKTAVALADARSKVDGPAGLTEAIRLLVVAIEFFDELGVKADAAAARAALARLEVALVTGGAGHRPGAAPEPLNIGGILAP